MKKRRRNLTLLSPTSKRKINLSNAPPCLPLLDLRVEPVVAHRLPHSPVLADFPHTVLQERGFAKIECTTRAGGIYQISSSRCIRSQGILPGSRLRRFNQKRQLLITRQR